MGDAIYNQAVKEMLRTSQLVNTILLGFANIQNANLLY